MPTALDYDGWAERMTELQPHLGTLLAAPIGRATPDALQGGSLAVATNVALEASHQNAFDAVSRLSELVAECRRRAQVCRQFELDWQHHERRVAAYDDAMSRYEQELARAEGGRIGMPPSPPDPPPRPADWVERG